MHTCTFCPAVTSFPPATPSVSSQPLQERISIISFFFTPSSSFPSAPPSVFLRLCLIYPFLSDKVSGDERHLLHALWRCIALLNYVQGQGLVCIRWYWECIANRWRERTRMADRLINKIYYGNATEERERCDLLNWFALNSHPATGKVWESGLIHRYKWKKKTILWNRNHLKCAYIYAHFDYICIYIWKYIYIFAKKWMQMNWNVDGFPGKPPSLVCPEPAERL